MPPSSRTKRMTAIDVFDRAIALLRDGRDDLRCPYCACARAKTELDSEGDEADLAPLGEVIRQLLTLDIRELPEDAPLVETRKALRPYCEEIASCPSPMSMARMIEVLSLARAALAHSEEVGLSNARSH